MKKKKRAKPKNNKKTKPVKPDGNSYLLHSDLLHLKKDIEQLWEFTEKTEERLQDIEIHVNLLTR